MTLRTHIHNIYIHTQMNTYIHNVYIYTHMTLRSQTHIYTHTYTYDSKNT